MLRVNCSSLITEQLFEMSNNLEYGTLCSFEFCQQLEFLPYKCKLCASTYCVSHRNFEFHKQDCSGRKQNSDNQVIQCPVCQHAISGTSSLLKTPEEINRLVDQHIASGCKLKETIRKKRNACNEGSCHKTELIPFVCKSCNGKFCVRHRQSFDHHCHSQAISVR